MIKPDYPALLRACLPYLIAIEHEREADYDATDDGYFELSELRTLIACVTAALKISETEPVDERS